MDLSQIEIIFNNGNAYSTEQIRLGIYMSQSTTSMHICISIISDSISMSDQARIGFDDLRFYFSYLVMYIYTIYISFW